MDDAKELQKALFGGHRIVGAFPLTQEDALKVFEEEEHPRHPSGKFAPKMEVPEVDRPLKLTPEQGASYDAASEAIRRGWSIGSSIAQMKRDPVREERSPTPEERETLRSSATAALPHARAMQNEPAVRYLEEVGRVLDADPKEDAFTQFDLAREALQSQILGIPFHGSKIPPPKEEEHPKKAPPEEGPAEREIKRRGTASLGDISVRIIPHPSVEGYSVETTVAGDRRPPVEPPMTIADAQKFALEQLKNPRPVAKPPEEKPEERAPEKPKADRPYVAASDLADRYRNQGLSRERAWDQFVIDTILSPRFRSEPLDAKDFGRLFDKPGKRP